MWAATIRSRTPRLALAGLLMAAAPRVGADDDASAQPAPPARTVVIGEEYNAGGIHRALWGTDYRPLWTAPTQVQVLDLHTFGGGLTFSGVSLDHLTAALPAFLALAEAALERRWYRMVG